jgi:cell division protein FtsW (lipid II flippase)
MESVIKPHRRMSKTSQTLHEANMHLHTAFRNVCAASSLALLSLAAHRFDNNNVAHSAFLVAALAFLGIALTIAGFLYYELRYHHYRAELTKWRNLVLILGGVLILVAVGAVRMEYP